MQPKSRGKTSRCVILTQGSYPTISLNKTQIDLLVKMAKTEGFEPEIDAQIKNSGLVIGVETFELFDAASQGIQTKLVPTGLGTKLYQKMFPQGEVVTVHG